MTLINSCLISCAAFIGLIGASATPPTLTDINRFSFVNLQKNTTISASFSSQGCFHSNSGTMTSQNKTKSVSLADMVKLDKYLRELALKQGSLGGCTSSTSYTLNLKQDGKSIGQMTLRDDFCMGGKDMISPEGLRYKLFEQENVEQISLKPE